MKNLILLTGIVLSSTFSMATPNIDMTCSVVAVGEANDYILEEGLGSIYDISPRGYAEADADSTGGNVFVQPGKYALNLGQGGWNQQTSRISSRNFVYDKEGEEAEGLEIKVKDDLGSYTWKVFTELKIVIITFTGNKYRDAHLATMDCSGVKDIRSRQ